MDVITRKAIDEFLNDHGVRKGITKEKMDGTYRRPEILKKQGYMQECSAEYLIETTKKFYDKYGDSMFDKNKGFREQLLDRLGGKMIMLKAHPELIRAMYRDAKEESDIPEALRIEGMFKNEDDVHNQVDA